MGSIQVRVDDSLKQASDKLFSSLGLDTPTAIRIFLTAALEQDGFPFDVRHSRISPSLKEAVDDAISKKNLYGPYMSVQEAVDAMLEE